MSDDLKQYVQLTSSDGFDFVIQREAALVSGTLRGMLSQSSTRDEVNPGLTFRQVFRVQESLGTSAKYKRCTAREDLRVLLL